MKFIGEFDHDKFYLQKHVEDRCITVSITNLKSLWQERLSETDIVERFKALNPMVQAKPEWIVTHVHSSLDPDKSTFALTIESTNLTVDLQSTSDIKAKMRFVFVAQDSHKFFKMVTNPMVSVIVQLMEQRTKLLDLVKSKDLELREYKLEGAEISRKNVETDEMIEKAFVEETTEDFTSRIRQLQGVPELKLTPDLMQVYSETMNLRDDTVRKVEAEGTVNGDQPERTGTLQVKAEKRPLGNHTIIQVPRAKERKKNFKL